jgi:sulfur-oxidizing protein SoxY
MKELPHSVAVAALALVLAVPAGQAGAQTAAAPAAPLNAPLDAEEKQRWQVLQETFFEGRRMEEAGDRLAIQAPGRAHDAAIVPVKVVPAPGTDIRTLSLLVDDNPVPRAAVLRFGPASAGGALETRVRVDEYTHIHAVAETADGRLLVTSAFVKASGGCSAPALKDPEEAMARLGRMKLNLPETMTAGTPVTAQLLISHPNNSGLQFDQVSRFYIPAHYVQDISIRYDGVSVLEAETDISISEDPSLHFTFVPSRKGVLEVVARDSKGGVYERSWAVDAAPAS